MRGLEVLTKYIIVLRLSYSCLGKLFGAWHWCVGIMSTMYEAADGRTYEVLECTGRSDEPLVKADRPRRYVCRGKDIHRVTFWRHRKHGCPEDRPKNESSGSPSSAPKRARKSSSKAKPAPELANLYYPYSSPSGMTLGTDLNVPTQSMSISMTASNNVYYPGNSEGDGGFGEPLIPGPPIRSMQPFREFFLDEGEQHQYDHTPVDPSRNFPMYATPSPGFNHFPASVSGFHQGPMFGSEGGDFILDTQESSDPSLAIPQDQGNYQFGKPYFIGNGSSYYKLS